MCKSGQYFTLLSFLILVSQLLVLVNSQDNITFSPATPLCPGERVEMVCYIEHPASEMFAFDTASVSFNGSNPVSLSEINGALVLDGVDLSRYSANTDGLTLSTARPAIRLFIDSYLPSDSNTLIGCHGIFPNTSISDAIVSGMPMRQADFISLLEGTTTVTILSDCAIQISFFVTQIPSNRLTDLSYTFTLIDELKIITSPTDSLTPNVAFSTLFTRDICYGISVSVENCPNRDVATASSVYFSLQGIRNSTGKLLTSSTNSTRIEWKYNTNLNCSNNYTNLILTEGLFSFDLTKDNNSIAYNITEYSLYLPDRFDFYIPPEMQSSEYSLRINLCGEPLTDQPIPITLKTATDNTITIVLGILVGLLILLFIVICVLIVLFLIFFYLKRNKNKK